MSEERIKPSTVVVFTCLTIVAFLAGFAFVAGAHKAAGDIDRETKRVAVAAEKLQSVPFDARATLPLQQRAEYDTLLQEVYRATLVVNHRENQRTLTNLSVGAFVAAALLGVCAFLTFRRVNALPSGRAHRTVKPPAA